MCTSYDDVRRELRILDPSLPINGSRVPGVNDTQAFRLRTPGTASKAMRLLGLTSLPPDAVHMERPPPQRRASYQEGDKALSALGTVSCGFNGLLIERKAGVSRNFTPLGSRRGEVTEDIFSIAGTESSSENEEYSRDGENIGESGGLLEPNFIRPRFYSHSETVVAKQQRAEIPTVTRESSLKLSETDLDDQFIEAVTALTAQFPEPPLSTPSNTPSASTREEGEFTTAPSTSWLGKGKRVDRGASTRPKSFASYRGLRQEQGHRRRRHERRYSHGYSRGQFDVKETIKRPHPQCDLFEL